MLDFDEMREMLGQMPNTRNRLVETKKILPVMEGTEELHDLITFLLNNYFSPPCWVSISEQVCAHTIVLASIMARPNLPELDTWKVGLKESAARAGLENLSSAGYISRVVNIAVFASTYMTMMRHAERHGYVMQAASPEVTELEDLL